MRFASWQVCKSLHIVPNGAELFVAEESGRTRSRHVLFLASLDYSANIEALEYLCHEIAPLLLDDLLIKVAGSNADSRALALIKKAPPNIEYVGFVDDAIAAMRSCGAFVVPLRSGGGTRLKVLEAMSVGAPVVATSKAVEGLGITAGREALIGESGAEIAQMLVNVVNDKDLQCRLANAGMRAVSDKFEWRSIGEKFNKIVQKIAAEQ